MVLNSFNSFHFLFPVQTKPSVWCAVAVLLSAGLSVYSYTGEGSEHCGSWGGSCSYRRLCPLCFVSAVAGSCDRQRLKHKNTHRVFTYSHLTHVYSVFMYHCVPLTLDKEDGGNFNITGLVSDLIPITFHPPFSNNPSHIDPVLLWSGCSFWHYH